MKTDVYEISKGVKLRFIETDKFKTNVLSVYFCLPLCRENVTCAALIPRVLKRGSVKYPTMAQLSRRAEELYGASIGADILKEGDELLIRASAQFVSDSFITETIIKDIAELLYEFVLCPITKDGAFDKTYVEQEKENAKNFIKGLINDKKEYAQVRCNEIMFEGDPYGNFSYGYVEDLECIDEKNLYDFYKDVIETAEVNIFASGCFDKDAVKAEIEKTFGKALSPRDSKRTRTNLAAFEESIKVKEVTEEITASQSKLCMGFNCGIEPASDECYAVAVFSCIYGGSPFSKLFNNVREKLSLAYYVFSAFNRQKSFMRISAGIEVDKFSAAYDEILLQLDMMKNGDFSDDEIASAKKYLKTQVGSIKDSLVATEDFYMTRAMMLVDESPDEFLEKINKVSREEIIAAANKMQLDTVYFLKGVSGDEI